MHVVGIEQRVQQLPVVGRAGQRGDCAGRGAGEDRATLVVGADRIAGMSGEGLPAKWRAAFDFGGPRSVPG
ncbi:MAG TPA: hypothetical protein DHU96_21260 [Actinobacteria bacterium]|nr:hypothetical protein [Actinomycetota bacterium]